MPATAHTKFQVGETGWKQELNKIQSRYLFIGSFIAVLLNPVFGLIDYISLHDMWSELMVIRVTVAFFVLFSILYKPWINNNPGITGFVILMVITSQDAYIFSYSTLDNIHNNALSYLVDFVGASMVLLWNLPLAIVYFVCLLTVNAVFFAVNSPLPLEEFMADGGLLVLAGSVFSLAMIVFRYNSVKSMLISKMELVKTNEWMAVQNEIIEQKSSELQRSNSRLKEFAYIVSHDLKTPLRGIKNIAQWIREDCSDTLSSEGQSHLRLIDKQIVKMENLILGVLEYSKSGHVNAKTEWIRIDDLIHEIIETVDVDKKVLFNIQSEVPELAGTRIVISQVLQNLLSNSIKHNHNQDKSVTVEVKEIDDQVQFMIADNGPGIARDDQSKIFDLFQTLSGIDNYENSGIGLPVAKKMIEESGGHMWVESLPGKGAAFYFTLPKVNL